MGAHSPVPWVDADTEKAIVDDVLRPTVQALGDEGIRYRGCLYAGLMLTAGGPKVLEFNARFGDPETQVLVRRIHGDLAALLLSCAEGGLGSNEPRWAPEVCVGVVLASGGYPGGYETGKPISGLEVAGGVPGVQVFHGGTTRRQDRVVTAGGRVLTVAALGADIEQARRRAYEAASMIHFEGMAYRQDIGADVPVHRGLG
jgi:phosphoribosylamine--glycine ligase